MELKPMKVSDMTPHPWQSNVPDMTGPEWTEFLEDVRENGVREPVTVSMRTGKPMIVDGRQRWRAAQEIGILTLVTILPTFVDEISEIEHIVRTAKLRRTLTLPQRVALAEAYEAALKADSEARSRANLVKNGAKNGQNGAKSTGATADTGPASGSGTARGVKSDTSRNPAPDAPQGRSRDRAAKQAGLSSGQLHKAKKIKACGIPNLVEAWEKGEIKTDPAYRIVTEAPLNVRKAIRDGKLTFAEALEKIKKPAPQESPKPGESTPKTGVIQFSGATPPKAGDKAQPTPQVKIDAPKLDADPNLTEDETLALEFIAYSRHMCDIIADLPFGELRNHGEELLTNMRNALDDLKNEIIARQKEIRDELISREESLEKGKVD